MRGRQLSAEHLQLAAALRAAGCVFAEEEAEILLSLRQGQASLSRMLAQRVAGLPLEHVVGWAEFCGLRISVGPGVFVPRKRTELLAREALRLVKPDAVVLDLCCGSGALAAAVLATMPDVELYAADLDPLAMSYAHRNATGAAGIFMGDLFKALPDSLRGRIDMVLANVPYVPTAEISMLPVEARRHETRWALDGGLDGLDLQRRVVAEAPRWLAPGGALLIETSDRQLPTTTEIFERHGFEARVARSEDLGATVVVGVVHDFLRPGELS